MEPVTSIIVGLIIAGGGATIGAFIKKRINKKSKTEESLNNLIKDYTQSRKEIWRLKKTVLIMAKILDAQTTQYHGDLPTDLLNIAEELLDNNTES